MLHLLSCYLKPNILINWEQGTTHSKVCEFFSERYFRTSINYIVSKQPVSSGFSAIQRLV